MNPTQTSHQDHIKSHICSIRCISWTAIVIGALTAFSLSFLLNLLALAIGLSAFPAGENGATAFAIGGFLGLVVLAIVTMFPAGWVAGVLGRGSCLKRNIGELYGIGTWGLALILTIWMASYVSQFLAQSNYVINRNVIAVKVTGDMTVNKLPAVISTKKETPMVVKVNAEPSVTLGVATFVTFFLFFVGFLACCFGGRLGMSYRRDRMFDSNFCPHCK